ncbi:MAG: DegT/DnrJ/EryC1/StrS family aminotransferase [Chloroflexota bacterium]
MIVPFVDLNIQHQPIKTRLLAEIENVIDRGDFCLGEALVRLEVEFAHYCGTRFAIGVDSGHSALKLSLLALGIQPGDEVILPSHTFMATAAAVMLVGAIPILVEVDPRSYTIDPTAVQAAITSRTRAIIPVHLYGRVADMDAINAIARRHDLVVIEDACQAHGALYHGQRSGSLGHAAGFSFYPSKNLGAMGDGGMVVTDDTTTAEHIRAMRNVGQFRKGHHETTSYNHRLDTLQAAILRVKLEHLDEANQARHRAADLYRDALDGADLLLPEADDAPDTTHVYHLYVVRSRRRDALREFLHKRDIATGIHYPIPIHKQPIYYAQYTTNTAPLHRTEHLCTEILSLPMFPGITESQIGYVADQVKAFARKTRAPQVRML